MRAVRLEQFGSLPAVTTVADPVIQDDLDVIVQVEGAGLCRTDLHALEGQLAEIFPRPLPFTLGHETAGRVVEAGRAVRGAQVGTRVLLHPLQTCGHCASCRQGSDMQCGDAQFTGLIADGGMAEYVRTSARTLVPLRPETDTKAIAPLADAGLTAYHAVKKAAALLTAESVCVVLGCGGLGHLAIQLLRAMTDSLIVGVDPAADARALASKVGADLVAEGSDVSELLDDVAGGSGATVVLDFVGEGDAPNLAVQLLSAKGSYFVVGYGGEIRVPTMEMVLKELRVEGNLVGTYQELRELAALYERGLIESVVVSYPLDDAAQAFRDLSAGELVGRAVLVP